MIVRMKNTFRMLLAAMLIVVVCTSGYIPGKNPFPKRLCSLFHMGISGDEEAVRYAVSMDGLYLLGIK